MPQEVQKIAFTITIYEAIARKQNFKQVENLYLRIFNESNQNELLQFDLGNYLTIENALVFGELYRHNKEWKFNAISSGFDGGLAAYAETSEFRSKIHLYKANKPMRL